VHAVLLGPYSRDGWFHPGPAYYYALALPYRALGSTSRAMLVGALLFNGASVAGMAVLARRYGGQSLYYLTLLGCAVFAGALGASFLRDPWNPYLPVLPFGVLVFLTWAAARGERWAIPGSVAVASFVVQTHVGFAPLALGLFVWGMVMFAVRTWRAPDDGAPADRRRALVWPIVATVVALLVFWVPPVIDQIVHEPGNFGRVLNYFTHPSSITHTFAEGWRLVCAQFALPPQWVTGPGALTDFTGEPALLYQGARLPLLLLAFAAAMVLLWKRKETNTFVLGITVVLAFGLGVVSLMRTIGPAYEYRLHWALLLGMLAGVVTLAALWDEIVKRRPAAMRVLTALALGGLGVFAVAGSIGAVRADMPLEPQSRVLGRLITRTRAALPDGNGEVVVSGKSFAALEYEAGLLLALERAGDDVRADGITRVAYGDHRAYDGEPVRARVVLVAEGATEPTVRRPRGRLVASEHAGPLTIHVYVATPG
jgi:hypothetical protein